MASGKAHANATLAIGFVGGVFAPLVAKQLGFNASGQIYFTLSAIGGIPIALYVTPDQDQEGMSRIEYQLVKSTLGLAFLLLAFWGPFSGPLVLRELNIG